MVEKDRIFREKLRYVQAHSANDTDGYWQKVQFETLQAWTDYQKELSTEYPTWYATRNERMISNEEQIL